MLKRTSQMDTDEEGVSEVLGSILTLLVTVALFGSVFAGVTQLEGPESELNVEIDAHFEHQDGENYVIMTHEGGESLDTDSLTFFLFVGEISHRESPVEPESSWNIGEERTLHEEGGEWDIDENSTIELMIRDDDTNRLIYQTMLLEDDRNIVDIRNSYIEYKHGWRNYAEPNENITIKTEVAAPIWRSYKKFDPKDLQIKATVYQDDILIDKSDNSSILSSETINLTHSYNGKFYRKLRIHAAAADDRYRVKITAEHQKIDLDIDPSYIYLNIGKEPVDYYEEELVIGRIWFQPGSPSNGDPFTIEAEIFNEGEVDQEANWKIKDDIQENSPFNSKQTTTISSGAAATRIKASYPEGIRGHGPHEITFEVIPKDDEWDGDKWKATVYVDPNVMLVRDNIPKDRREGKLMTNALEALNLKYDPYSVEPDEEIDDLNGTLSQYSLTIWMTGNETEDPYLADGEVLNSLTTYIEGDLNGCLMNGSLWLIGSNLGTIDGFGDLEKKLGANSFGSQQDIAEKTLVNPEADKNGTYGDFKYNVGGGKYAKIKGLKDNYEENNTLVDEKNSDQYFGIGYEGIEKERTAVNSFLYESLEDTGQQTAMAGEVIEWLSNMTTRTGIDVSVTSQTIEPTAPMFNDEVKINATLRNNGPEDLHVSVRAVRNRGEEILTPEGDNQLYLPRNGGTNTTTFTWVANELGRHTIVVKADYFNEIDEVTKKNNEITYKDLNVTDDEIEVNVHFSTLLVDADGSEYNDNYTDVTADVKDSFDRLGHEQEIDYDYHYVGENGDGPSKSLMEDYNAIYWVTGENEFFPGEIENYLDDQENGANVMFIGEHILNGISSDSLLKKMGIDSVNSNPAETDILMGQKDHNLGHGLRYRVEEKNYTTFESNENGEVLFKSEDGEYNFASTYDKDQIKTVYMGVNPNSIEGPVIEASDFGDWPAGDVNVTRENAREELIYTSLWYFGKRDDRTELRVTDYDLRPSEDHPHTGRSYKLAAKIENIGYKSASALIRFKDGTNHLASQTIRVEGSSRTSVAGSSHFEVSPGSTTAEVSWTPTHGGIRPIKVRVDPIGRTDEIEDDDEDKLMEFHNQAILEHPVYYFYDDMENGTEYWDRQATIANINGEAPIDYLGDEDNLSTDVIGDWDWNKSKGKGVENVSDHARSDPNSYFMEEPVGLIAREVDAIVSIVIDSSQSMVDRTYEGETWLWHAKQAAKVLVNDLSNESAVGVWNFGGSNPEPVISPPRKLEGSGRQEVIDNISSIDGDPITPLWDAVGASYKDVVENMNKKEFSDLEPAVVVLSDGGDVHSNDHSAVKEQDIEAGSTDWAPWKEMNPPEDLTDFNNYPTENYPGHWGKYRQPYYESATWWKAGKGSFKGERKGLLNSSIPMFTIGLGVEHNPNIPEWDTVYSEPAKDSDADLYINEDDESAVESGTQEYNLWRIANTSDAEYFHSPDPEDLNDIFLKIGDYLSGPQNLTSVGDTTPLDNSSDELTAEDEGNFDKYAVTPELDLSNTSSAWLTFWQKYRLLQGVNGAYIQIGYEDNNGEMKWRYIKPSIGPYTGNLLEGGYPTDSFDNTIEWVWNGKSADGTMNWERVKIDLLKDDYNIPEDFLDSVRLRFYYKQFGGSTVPGGWWIDDLRVDVTRNGDWWNDDIKGDMHDVWQLKNTTDMEGRKTTAWWNGIYGEAVEEKFKGGIDNSLITDPIDLRYAQSAIFKAEFKFNINEEDGTPPDGFRVEVSEDQGETWSAINLGLRAAKGVSGNGSWVTAEDMTRLNIDLSDYSGNIILLRFRVVTNSDEGYDNYQNGNLDFGGFYINNVMVIDDELR